MVTRGSYQAGFSAGGIPYMGVGVIKSGSHTALKPRFSVHTTESQTPSGVAKPGGTKTPSRQVGNSTSKIIEPPSSSVRAARSETGDSGHCAFRDRCVQESTMHEA